MHSLAEFQQRFADALRQPDAVLETQLGAGLQVHRNTVMKALCDALASNYPVTLELLGSDCFQSLARRYAHDHPPREASLHLYGEHFAALLAAEAELQEWPYLAPVASLERYWTESYFAVDAPVLTASELAMDANALAALRLSLHPATRVASLACSALDIWRHHQQDIRDELAIDLRPQWTLITRPEAQVVVTEIDQHDALFLHFATTDSLGMAATRLIEKNNDAEVAAVLARLLHAGVFAPLQWNPAHRSHHE